MGALHPVILGMTCNLHMSIAITADTYIPLHSWCLPQCHMSYFHLTIYHICHTDAYW